MLCARGADLRAARQQPAAEELYREIENIRAAWRWAVEQGQVELIGSSAESLFFFYEMRSWFREGVEVFARAAGRLAEMASAGSLPLARAVWGKLLAYQGWCAFQIGRQAEAQALLNQSLAILRTLARDVELALPLCYLAALAYYSGDYADSERLAGEALRISQACGNQHGAAVALTVFGQVAALVGRYEDARRYSEASLAVERELGNRWGMAFPLISLGKVAQTMGAHRQARRYFEEGLAIRQAFGDTRGVALCMRYLGAAAEALADYAASDRYYREALALFQSIGNQAGVVETLAELGYNALAQHEPAAAASHFHSALRVAWQSASTPRILEALVGMAASLAGEQPRRAIELAALARDHSAATQAIRDRAEVILSRLVPNAPNDVGSEHNLPATGRLETMVQALLREDV